MDYQTQNAGFLVDGYLFPHPNESAQAAFDRAKNETVKNLEIQLANVRALTLERFEAVGFHIHNR